MGREIQFFVTTKKKLVNCGIYISNVDILVEEVVTSKTSQLR